MLSIFRRHRANCRHKKKGRKSVSHCNCPLHVEGILVRKPVTRRSLGVGSMDAARRIVASWEFAGEVLDDTEPVTVAKACETILEHLKADIQETTLAKYDVLTRRLVAYAEERGIRYITEFNFEELRTFRGTWPDSPLTATKNIERLRSMFGTFHDYGWLPENPARKLKLPKVKQKPTLPFERDEMNRIIEALDAYPDNYGRALQENALRLRGLVYVMRWGGLGIRDAVTLRRDGVKNGKLFLRRAKTGQPVWCPLPDWVVATLDTVIGSAPEYYFWTGSNPKSAVGNWQRSLQKLFKLADVPQGHAHRFRDTFAVELLLAGVPIERVSVLLGHSSIRITEKHYSPWVESRQKQLEADVTASWRSDPTFEMASSRTRAVHLDRGLVN